MMIIGCDFHTRMQQIAMIDTETGEFTERALEHENGEVRDFYAGLTELVLVGIESTGAGAEWNSAPWEHTGKKKGNSELRIAEPARSGPTGGSSCATMLDDWER